MALGRKKVHLLFFFLLAGKQYVFLRLCPEEQACLETSSFCLLGCSLLRTLQEFYPSLYNKAEKWTPCWEIVGGPLSPKRTLWRQSGTWHFPYTTGSGTPPSSWAQENTCSSWGNLYFSQLCVFSSTVDVLSSARSEQPLLDELMILAHEGWKDLKIHILVWSWILLGAVGCASAACCQLGAASKVPWLPHWPQNVLLFNLGVAEWRLYLEVPQPCLFWFWVWFVGFFNLFVLQVEIIFHSVRHLIAFVGISRWNLFTHFWICYSEQDHCLGADEEWWLHFGGL